MKPFVPPLLKNRKPSDEAEGPEVKRQKLDTPEGTAETEIVQPQIRKFSQPPLRRPLLTLKNTPTPTSSSLAASSGGSATPQLQSEWCYNVLWRKYTTKKNKTWDGDGILVVSGGRAVLKDTDGTPLGTTFFNRRCEIGEVMNVGGKEVEIDSALDRKDFLSGKVFLPKANEVPPTHVPVLKNPASVPKKPFKTPVKESTAVPVIDPEVPQPRYKLETPGSFLLPRPPAGWTKKTIVDVVVDPYVGINLRPHQKEGIKFMYECVMGYRDHPGEGCILADEMGLGKTLQTIALLWTLLRQNPIYKQKPVVKRALVVCPVTLTSNWKKEFTKWLTDERVRVMVVDAKANINNFVSGNGTYYDVMIIGYERLQKLQDKLSKFEFDIVVADEGHRLKGEKNKAAQAIMNLNTPRRIILSGTPLQNDLHEFFVMVDFVNPGVLSTYNTFKREFENPIVKSRQPGATAAVKEKGEARSEELARLTNQFILRRTAEILSKYLPPKTEWVVMCKPTTVQIEFYEAILDSARAVALGSPQASLQLINVLKKLCNSPALLSTSSNEEDGNFGASLTIQQIKASPIKTSGKLYFLDRMLFTLYNKTSEKVVLVSNYTATLDVLQNLLGARKYAFLRLDGTTPPAKRQALVDKFNRVPKEEAFAFLLSAKAGGVGLNLIGASRLVLVDSDWNPAVDAQAMARVHRDGQKHDVKIYRLLTSGCMDERIFQRQLTKKGLADSIVDQKETAQSFSQSELRNLFTLDRSVALSSETCLTHQLMGCGCDCIGEVPDEDEVEAVTELDSDGEEELPDFSKLVKASQVDEAVIKRLEEDELAKRRGGKLGALKGWGHIKGSVTRKKKAENDPDPIILEDDVLQAVVGHANDTVGFLFVKRSG